MSKRKRSTDKRTTFQRFRQRKDIFIDIETEEDMNKYIKWLDKYNYRYLEFAIKSKEERDYKTCYFCFSGKPLKYKFDEVYTEDTIIIKVEDLVWKG